MAEACGGFFLSFKMHKTLVVVRAYWIFPQRKRVSVSIFLFLITSSSCRDSIYIYHTKMRLPIEKLSLTKDELIVAMVTAVLVRAFEMVGEKLALGIFWIVVTYLKFSKNCMLMPLVYLGDKAKECLTTSYQESIKSIEKKCSRGSFTSIQRSILGSPRLHGTSWRWRF